MSIKSEQEKPTSSEISEPVQPALEKWIIGKTMEFTDEELASISETIQERTKLGIEKYGTSLYSHNGRDSQLDLQQELADTLQYFFQMKMEKKKIDTLTTTLLKAICLLHEECDTPETRD